MIQPEYYNHKTPKPNNNPYHHPTPQNKKKKDNPIHYNIESKNVHISLSHTSTHTHGKHGTNNSTRILQS